MHRPQEAFLFPILVPLRSSIDAPRPAWVTYALFALFNFFYLAGLFAPEPAARLLALPAAGGSYQFLTHALLHPGLLALLVDLYFLAIFGPPLESRIGSGRFAALLAIAAGAGGIAHKLIAPGALPAGGAAAMLLGMLGAYLILFPYSTITCWFGVLLLVFPVYIRRPQIAAVIFVVGFWGLHVATRAAEGWLGSTMAVSAVAPVAQIAALVAGAGLAAAAYGLHAFTQAAVAAARADQTLEQALARDLNQPTPAPRRAEERLTLTSQTSAIEATPEPLRPLHRVVLLHKHELVRDVLRGCLRDDPMATLAPGPQMDLVRMLLRMGEDDLAERALENLLARHGTEPVAATARLELARLLVRRGREPERAAELLDAFLNSRPPFNLEMEAQELVSRLRAEPEPEAEASHPPFDPGNVLEDGAMDHELDGRKAREHAQAAFGNPEDTENILAAGAWTPADGQPAPHYHAPLDPVPGPPDPNADSGYAVRLDDGSIAFDGLGDSAPPALDGNAPGLMPANTPHAVAPEEAEAPGLDLRLNRLRDTTPADRALARPKGGPRRNDETAISLNPLDEEDEGPEELRRAAEASFQVLSRTREVNLAFVWNPPPPLPDVAPPAKPAEGAGATAPRIESPESSPPAPDATTPDAFCSSLVSTEANVRRAAILRGDKDCPLPHTGRCSLILAPGASIDMSIILATLGPTLGLNPDAVHHAILRRRGLLASSIGVDEARNLAVQLSRYGQTVALVPETPALDFGEPLDLVSIHESGRGVRFSHEKGAEDRTWDQVLLLGGGWVGLGPGTPCRAVLDLFLRDPNRRLRLWEPTFVYPAGSQGDRHDRFVYLVRHLVESTRAAIQTRTLNTWLEGGDEQATTRFSNPIEYDNFLRWHLLAYAAPLHRFLPDKTATQAGK